MKLPRKREIAPFVQFICNSTERLIVPNISTGNSWKLAQKHKALTQHINNSTSFDEFAQMHPPQRYIYQYFAPIHKIWAQSMTSVIYLEFPVFNQDIFSWGYFYWAFCTQKCHESGFILKFACCNIGLFLFAYPNLMKLDTTSKHFPVRICVIPTGIPNG